jgi:type 1 glutamine amidotransferase
MRRPAQVCGVEEGSPLRLLFHVGGPAFHPVAEQARVVEGWLQGSGHAVRIVEGNAACDALGECDVFVLMGLYWTGKPPYTPLTPDQRAAFAAFVRGGGRVLAHHGGIASYDDWPELGRLVGFRWVWGTTAHSPFGTHRVRIADPGAPVVAGVSDFNVEDELYYDVEMDARARVHAVAEWEGRDRPMVCTLERPGEAGRAVYLANGHDLRAFRAPALRRLWLNAVGSLG